MSPAYHCVCSECGLTESVSVPRSPLGKLAAWDRLVQDHGWEIVFRADSEELRCPEHHEAKEGKR